MDIKTPEIPQPATLLQKLIQFDTTNPPGNEKTLIRYVQGLLSEIGIQSHILALDENRPNLVARLTGEGNSPPLLLYGHVDVVTTENQQWTYPPFEGTIADGYIWGRGALDMKGGAAMLISAFLKAKQNETRLPGDVILALVSDEEDGGDMGARFLVEKHPDVFAGVRYALGEFGGFSLSIGGKRFYPIQVTEKQICWIKATLRGAGGHGSMPVGRTGAIHRLGRFLEEITSHRLPVHITPSTRLMFSTISSEIKGITGFFLRQLLNPVTTDSVLNMLGTRGRTFDPLFHNTVSPTILHASPKVNVIPSEVSVELDGRLLPGYKPEQLLAELRKLTTQEVDFDVVRYDPGPEQVDMGLFEMLADILREADPSGIPLPMVLSGVTDGRYFSKLGIQTYGFLPMQLPADFNFAAVIHAADERIPVNSVDFGTQAIYEALKRF
jgi:acetylornithine deacetylase/succinyl-diaminopimelate desuccinylase-like protein